MIRCGFRAHQSKPDWEVELGVVIGAPAKYVEEANALSTCGGLLRRP